MRAFQLAWLLAIALPLTAPPPAAAQAAFHAQPASLPLSKATWAQVEAYPGAIHALRRHPDEAHLLALLTAADRLCKQLYAELDGPLQDAKPAARAQMVQDLRRVMVGLPGVVGDHAGQSTCWQHQ